MFKVNYKNNSDAARLNQIINQMSKLLTLSKLLLLTSAQIEQFLANCYFMFCVYYIIINGPQAVYNISKRVDVKFN